MIGDPSGTASPYIYSGASYILFTGYAITSDYFTSGICTAIAGSQIELETEYSYSKPASVDPTIFQSNILSQFVDYLGFASCTTGVTGTAYFLSPTDAEPSRTFTTLLTSRAASQLVSAFNSSSTSSTPATAPPSAQMKSTPTFNSQDKVAVGVVVPTVLVLSILGMILVLRRFRRSRMRKDSTRDTSDILDKSQPYLQQKAELEAEEKKKIRTRGSREKVRTRCR